MSSLWRLPQTKGQENWRGYIYKKKTQYFFKCHNCGAGHTFNNFLKSIDPRLHKEYVLEKYQSGQTRGNTPIPDKVPFQFRSLKFEKPQNKDPFTTQED